jgi:hypothetical protein
MQQMQHDLIEYQIMIEKKIAKENKKKFKKEKSPSKRSPKKDKKKKDKKKKKKKEKEKRDEPMEPPESIHSSVDGRLVRFSKR